MDHRGRLVGSINQSRWDHPARSTSPRLLLHAQPLLPRELAPPPRGHRRRGVWTAALLLLAGVGSTAALVLGWPMPPAADAATSPGPTRVVLAHVDRWLVAQGVGIEQVSLEGHRYTPDADIFDALELPTAGSMLRFDGTEAAARMLNLPWVQRVQIKPLVPNGLHIIITERTPYAVWIHDGRHQLIDQGGHVLAAVRAETFAQLPRVQGAGAQLAAADLHATLALFPTIQTRLKTAERVTERRWVLTLDDGTRIQLPAEQEAAALQRLAALQAGYDLLGRDLVDIDLRGPDLIVRPRAPGSAPGSIGTPPMPEF